MNLKEFADKVIENGIKAVREDYTKPEDAEKLKGALAGFEACRGKEPSQLNKLLQQAYMATAHAHREQALNYWEIQCFEAEVEWVCNVVSSVLQAEGHPVIVTPTARGYMAADKIIRTYGCIVVEKELPYPEPESVMTELTWDVGTSGSGSSGV